MQINVGKIYTPSQKKNDSSPSPQYWLRIERFKKNTPQELVKKGVQLPKCYQEWERVNEVFRDTLSKDIDFNDLQTAVNHVQETAYTVFSNRYGMKSTQESNGNHNLSKTQLKKY